MRGNSEFTNEVPGEYTDDERWLKIFKSYQALTLLGLILVTIILTKTFNLFGIGFIGTFIGIGISILIMCAISINVPADEYLKGASHTLFAIWLRKRYRKKNKIIFVKNYMEED